MHDQARSSSVHHSKVVKYNSQDVLSQLSSYSGNEFVKIASEGGNDSEGESRPKSPPSSPSSAKSRISPDWNESDEYEYDAKPIQTQRIATDNVCDESEIQVSIHTMTMELSKELGISTSEAVAILRCYDWNAEKAVVHYLNDPEATRKASGIGFLTSSQNSSPSTHPPTNTGIYTYYCNAYFCI